MADEPAAEVEVLAAEAAETEDLPESNGDLDRPVEADSQELVLREAEIEEAREHVTVSPATMPTPQEWAAMRAMAGTIALTRFVPVDLRGKPDEVLACILTGREMGIGPMRALREIPVIDGRPAPSAALLLSMMREHGVQILESDSTTERALIRARRPDTGEVMEVEWTYAEAEQVSQRGGSRLVDKANWKNYPSDMLWARAVGRLARRLAGDFTSGQGYAAEEVQDFDDGPSVVGYDDTGPYDAEPVGPGGSGLSKPTTWPGMLAAFEEIVYPNWYWDQWISQAIHARFPGKEDKNQLTERERKDAFNRTWSVVVELSKEFAPTQFPPPQRAEIGAAFKKMWAGIELEGPQVKLGPADGDKYPEPPEQPRPEWLPSEGEGEPKGEDAPFGATADEDIPFIEPKQEGA